MNEVNESSPAPSLRRLPFSVRLAPHFVNCLLAVLPEDDVSEEIEGLLFGMVETGFSVLRMFHLSSPIAGLGRQANFEELLKRSKTNPQLAGFSLLGWFSVRNVDGLEPDDIALHERNFGKSNDLALIVKVEPEGEFSLELYCRSADGTFTTSNHRSGTVRISNASPLTSPLEVAMEVHQDLPIPNRPVEREIDEDDSLTLLREAFASSTRKAIDLLKTGKPEQREEAPTFTRTLGPSATRNAGLGTSTPPALAFGSSGATAAAPARIPQETQQAPEGRDHEEEPKDVRIGEPESPVIAEATPKRVGTASAAPDAVLIRPETHRPPPSTDYLPPKPKPVSPERPPFQAQADNAPPPAFAAPATQATAFSRFSAQALRALPWRVLAIIFVAVAGVTFGVIYLRSAHAKGTLPQFVQAVWPVPGLDLKVAANGDRFQLSWNRDTPAVRNAREGVLDITDGANRHQILLGNSELENGSVLYLPNSDDVVFRLQVHGAAGQNATESLRVVGTARSNALEVSRPGDIPKGEAEAPGGTLASNRSSHEGANGQRAPVTGKPERARTGNIRQTRGGLPAAAAGVAVAKASAPQMSSAARAPGADTPEAAHVAAKLPAADSIASNPPRVDNPQTTHTGALAQSRSPAGSSVEKANTPETAQLSKPDERIAGANNNASKSAAVPTPEPARVSPPKMSVAGAQAPLTYNPPRPVKQVLPKVAALPPGAADAAGEVRVVVRVDESGRVIDARLVDARNKVGSMLASAALTAAKQWIFEPASLRGKNIASDHTIVFQFRH